MRPIVNERSCGSSSAGVSSFFREYFGRPNFPFPHRRPRRKIPGVTARSVYSKFSPTGEWHDAHALDSGRRCLVLRLGRSLSEERQPEDGSCPAATEKPRGIADRGDGASRIRLRAQRAASLNAEPRLRTGTPTNNRPADREAWCAPKDGASNRCAGRTNRETPGPARPESTASKRVTCAWRQELSGHSRRYRCGSERRTEVGRYGYVQEANSSRAPRQGGCPAR